MRTLLLAIVFCCVALPASAESGHGGPKLLNANVDLGNAESLQRGAKLFVNYCVSCHSAQYMRYGRVAADLGIPEDVIYGYPVTCEGGAYRIVQGLEIDEFSRQRMDATLKELEEERSAVAHLLG